MERWSGAAVAVWRHNTSVELPRTLCFVHDVLLVSKLCMWPAVNTHSLSGAYDFTGYFCSSCGVLDGCDFACHKVWTGRYTSADVQLATTTDQH